MNEPHCPGHELEAQDGSFASPSPLAASARMWAVLEWPKQAPFSWPLIEWDWMGSLRIVFYSLVACLGWSGVCAWSAECGGGMVGMGVCVIWGRGEWVWLASIGQGEAFWCFVVFFCFCRMESLVFGSFLMWWTMCFEMQLWRGGMGGSFLLMHSRFIERKKLCFFFLGGCGVFMKFDSCV